MKAIATSKTGKYFTFTTGSITYNINLDSISYLMTTVKDNYYGEPIEVYCVNLDTGAKICIDDKETFVKLQQLLGI